MSRDEEYVQRLEDRLKSKFKVGSEVRVGGEVGIVTGYQTFGSTPHLLVQFQGQSNSVPVLPSEAVPSTSSATKGPIGGRKKRTRRVKPRATRKRKHVRKA